MTQELGSKTLLRVRLPLWNLILFFFCTTPWMLFVSYIIWMKLSFPLTVSEGLYTLFLLILVGGWVVAIPSLLSSVLVTEFGIETYGLLVRKQKFHWDQIKAVSKSTFPTRSGLTYIISNSGEKMTVMGTMIGYSELLELIFSKAPNVENRIPSDSWGRHFLSVLRWSLIFVGCFIVYVFVRWLLA